MTYKKTIICSVALVSALMLAALPIYAKTNSEASSSSKIVNKGDALIDQRIKSLNDLMARVQEMKNISSAQKTLIVNNVQLIVTNLSDLKTRIDSGATSTLKADLKSITGAYRVYALAMPEVNILAAGDRITTIAAQLNAIQAKIQARVAASSAFSTSTVIAADLSDMTTKIADALSKVQASAAEVTPLVPDQGDKAVMQSNLTALKDARSKIKTAMDDLKAARKDVKDIIDIIKKTEKPDKSGEGTDKKSEASTTGQH